MRTLVLAAALAGAASLAACSDSAEDAAEATADAAATPEADAGATEAANADAVLNANDATAEQLSAAGISPEAASAIVAGRPYADVTALDSALKAAGAPADALTRVFVPVNLNSASEDAIKLIPGMTPKMVHEFLEYRPYEDMAEFDREIGKYVDEAEVARFRRYVTL